MPSTPDGPGRRAIVPAGLLLAVLLYVARAWPSLWTTVDDAWISARYAANAAYGNGLVYNAGEPPIEGFTNLLWTLWLAVGVWVVGLRLDGWMVVSGLVLGAITVVFAGLSARALTHRADASPTLASDAAAVLAGGLVAMDVHHAVVTTNGLESAMFDAGVMTALWAVLTARSTRTLWLAGVAVAILPLIRPEGIPVGLGLVCVAAVGQSMSLSTLRRRTLPTLVPLVVGLGLLIAWRFATYGDVVPNTFRAKAKGEITQYVQHNLKYLTPDSPFWIGITIALILALLVGWRDIRRWLVGCIAVGIVAIAFRVELWMPGGRLLVPSALLVYVLVAAALADRDGALSRIGAVLAGLAVIGACVLPFTRVENHVRRYDRIHSVVLWNGTAAAAEFLAKKLPEGSWMAVRDAGVLAHFVGPEVRVAELHNRALTQLHPDGVDARIFDYTPRNPEVVALTQARRDRPGIRYGNDRRVFQRLSEPYVYLGRVHQHYHRFYDLYVREDAGIPVLPENLVETRAGPEAPRP